MEERRQVTLSKADRATPVGRQLIDLLVQMSADGIVSRDEMNRLRGWLEIDHGVDLPALPFLHETIEQISSDGEVTEPELDQLALAIERVLPADVRLVATGRRKLAREARRVAQREHKRQTMVATRVEQRAARDAERARSGVLHKAEFHVAGAFRFAERREACERLIDDDSVRLEREPDNQHDANAILVLTEDDCELGYVPREEARAIAPLLDAGAEADVRIRRLWETPDGKIVPFVIATIRRGDASMAVESAIPQQNANVTASKSRQPTKPGAGCATALCVALLVLTFAALAVL
jgi:hypothetical protein